VYLASAGKELLDAAYEEQLLHRDEQNNHFKHFIDTPEAVQSLWQTEEPNVFYPSEWLAVNIVRDALIVSIRSRAAHQNTNTRPSISAIIGNGYARLSENDPSRAAHYDHELTDDYLFMDRLYESIATMGVYRTVQRKQVSEETMGVYHTLQGKQDSEEAIAA
jgi:hypothetical protein